MDYVIVGNGIIALTTAFRLLKAIGSDDKILIIGPNERADSASMAAAVMLNTFAEIEKQSLRSNVELYQFELSQKSTNMWPEFESEIIEGATEYRPKCFANGEPEARSYFELRNF